MRYFISLTWVLILAAFAFAGDTSSTSQPAVEPPVKKPAERAQDQGRFALGFNSTLLGYGGEVAMRVTHHSNVRASFNAFGYSRSFDKDGATYAAHFQPRSSQVHYDFFPWANHGFHVSPGMLAVFTNPLTATAVLSPNQNIKLGGTSYTSDPNNPATLRGNMTLPHVAPMITFGFRNIVRHDSKHFTILPIDLGVAFTGAPKINLSGSGNLCDSSGNCQPTSSSSIQQSMLAEQNKIDHSLRVLKVFPIISTGITYKF